MNSVYSPKKEIVQKAADSKAASVLDLSAQGESLQRKADIANSAVQREERPNNTGMPDNLKSGIESLSGFSMDNVRVHYNSSKPATVQALAYTQGTDIHVAPGQEKCLPHEAWHVAQQMAGRVSPTTNVNGMPVNDNAALEHEADVMGEKAVQCKNDSSRDSKHVFCQNSSVQRYVKEGDYTLSKRQGNDRKIAVKENEASTIYIKEGCSIPNDLKKLGLKKNGTENIFVDGETVTYQKIQQGRIDSVRFKEGNKEKQTELNAADKETSESLLKDQLEFVEALNDFCKDGNFEDVTKRIHIKQYLEFMIVMMKNSVPLKCLGADIIDAVFAMYHIACKDHLGEADLQAKSVIKDDLMLRLSQIKNEIEVAGFKPIVRTECSGSAKDRTRLMTNIPINQDGKDSEVCENNRYIVADFKSGNFGFSWNYHVGSCIEQNLTDDCLYVEDAVGKSSDACERANAHWFAHIYGVEEPSEFGDPSSSEINAFPYPVGERFMMNNRFNSVPMTEKQQSITEKCNKNWEVSFDKTLKIDKSKKVKLNLHLMVTLNGDCVFSGLFDRCKMMVEGSGVKKISKKESNKIFKEYHNYLVGVMDFMVQTANSAIDGWFVGKNAEIGLTDVGGVGKTKRYIMGQNFRFGDAYDMSLLSIYKANQSSQK